MHFKLFFNESSKITQPVYHGTGENFRRFSLSKSTQGIIWFTSDRDKIIRNESGASSKGYLLELKVDIRNPAGWEEYDKYVLDQLIQMGYDGVILSEKDGSFDGFVFDPKQVKIINKVKI